MLYPKRYRTNGRRIGDDLSDSVTHKSRDGFCQNRLDDDGKRQAMPKEIRTYFTIF